MLRLRFFRIFLLTFISLVILVHAGDSGPNWSKVVLNEVDVWKAGPEIGSGTSFEVNQDENKAFGSVNLTKDIDPKTTVRWKALFLNPDDNQYKEQAESKPTGLCDFLVFQSIVAQMFFENSNMTVCPFQQGYYWFPGSGPNPKAFPQRIPDGRDKWKIEVIAEKMGELVAHLVISADLIR